MTMEITDYKAFGIHLFPKSPGERSLLEHLLAAQASRSSPEWSSVRILWTDGSGVFCNTMGQEPAGGQAASSTPTTCQEVWHAEWTRLEKQWLQTPRPSLLQLLRAWFRKLMRSDAS